MKLTNIYYGTPCKILLRGKDITQDQVIELEKKHPDFEIKEIGYQSETGYNYKYAAFKK